MPITNREDAREVENRVKRIFDASSSERAGEIRGLFVEVLDFNPATGQVSLSPSPPNVALPASAERVAELDGVHVLYVALDIPETDRVRKAEAAAAAGLIADQIGDDLLLVITNTSASQIHLVYPSFESARPTLRRMIVERDLPRRTAVQQVSNIYWNRRDTGSIRTALDKAFDVEAVTKAFFEEYKRIFDRAIDRVEGFGTGEEEQDAKKLFVQTLFNRLMFIYFLSRKGWLTFGGDNDYLNALWRNYQAGDGEDKNFHVDRLKLLFFAGLNNPQSRDLSRNNPVLYAKIGAPPFLNGGLFEKTGLDKRAGVVVPDDIIERVLRDLFDRFNFTVMESTPFDIEVAVDPEMLGKVFEELVTGRHDTGSYYTPRPVVSFMCREALKGYLEGCDTGLAKEDIAKFVDERETSGVSLPSAPKVAEALEDVTVVDPACGSGAYLLGMMQELVDLRTALFNIGVDARSLYDLKLHIIQRNLYGVDIDEFAVNIAMLRLWLSLVIEYEGDTPEPLPNLDFKVVKGDSLLGPDPGPDNYGDLFRHRAHSVAAQLAYLKVEHMKATTDKDELKEKVERVQDELREALADTPAPDEAVDWRVEFAEVFDRGGFDVALANPPYIQLQKDGGKLGKLYRDVQYSTFVRTGDVYQLFYERGCQLLRPSRGLLAYITSNSWLKAEYGKRLRRYLSDDHAPLAFVELGKDVFESAIVDTGVLLLRKGSVSGSFPAVDIDHLSDSDFPPDESLWGRVRPDGEAPWAILSPLEQSVMDRMRVRGTPLTEWDIRINYGIKTGYNKAFIIDGETRQALLDQDSNSADILKPVLRGRDIRRYRAKWAGLWLVNIPWHFPLHSDTSIQGSSRKAEQLFRVQYPAVYQHLFSHKEALAARNRAETGIRYEWYALQRWGANYYEEFSKEKLFWMDMSPEGRFAYSNTEMYCNDKGFIMTSGPMKYLCAVLNSSLITWMMKSMALTTGMGLMQWKKFAVQRLPVPKLSPAQQRPFIKLVDSILDAKAADPDVDTAEQEAELDTLVYALYGLTAEEVGVVEGR